MRARVAGQHDVRGGDVALSLKRGRIPGVRRAPDHEARWEAGDRETRGDAEIPENRASRPVLVTGRATEDQEARRHTQRGRADRRLPTARALRQRGFAPRGFAGNGQCSHESDGDEECRRSPMAAADAISRCHVGSTEHDSSRSWSRVATTTQKQSPSCVLPSFRHDRVAP